MFLESIRAYALSIPFNLRYRHVPAERGATHTLWVEVRTRNGMLGFGEGCPRDCVTAEKLYSAAAFVSRHARSWIHSVHDLAGLKRWLRDNRVDIDANASAWAAVELALLDVLAREQDRSVEALLGLPPLSGYFRYTGVLEDGTPEVFEAQLARYRKSEFRDFKIKLSGDRVRDLSKVQALKAAGISAQRVRADARNLWKDSAVAIDYLRRLDFAFHAVAQPLPYDDLSGLRKLAEALGTAIILDAMPARACPELDRLRDSWMLNVRVSKLGGLLRALEVAQAVRSRGGKLVVGAHVGETSLLTRAALTVAHSARDVLAAQEGAFGTHLLVHDVIDPSLMFGRGGLLRIPTRALWHDSGLGMTVTRPVLRLAPLTSASVH